MENKNRCGTQACDSKCDSNQSQTKYGSQGSMGSDQERITDRSGSNDETFDTESDLD